MSPLTGTIATGDPTCRIRIMPIPRYCIIPTRGFMDTTPRTDTIEATIHIMDIIEVTILTRMSIGVIGVEVSIPRSHGAPIIIEAVGAVKIDGHGIREV